MEKNIGVTIPGNWSFEIWRISWNPPKNLINQITQQKLFFSFMECSGKAMSLDLTWNLPDFTKSARFHVKSAGFHEIRRISWIWAFGWSPSIGLSFERPNRTMGPWLICRTCTKHGQCSFTHYQLLWQGVAKVEMEIDPVGGVGGGGVVVCYFHVHHPKSVHRLWDRRQVICHLWLDRLIGFVGQ